MPQNSSVKDEAGLRQLETVVEELRVKGDVASASSAWADRRSLRVLPFEFLHLALQQLHPASFCGLSLQHRSIFGLPVTCGRHWCFEVWKFLMVVVDLTYAAFITPWTLAMVPVQTGHTNLYILDSLMGLLYVLDLLLKLHMVQFIRYGFYNLAVTNGPGIVYVYRHKGHLGTDTVVALSCILQAFLPLMVGKGHSALQLLYVVRMLRLVRVLQVVRALSRGELSLTGRQLVRAQTSYLVSLVYCVAVTVNFLSCMWYATAAFAQPDDLAVTWVGHVGGRDLSDADVWVRYLAAVYYTVTTITTTGYGDITPQSALEQCVSICIMLCGALFMSFIIGTVAGMINSGGPEAQRVALYREKVVHLYNFVRKHPIDPALERFVYQHYAAVWASIEQEQREWDEVMGGLSDSMRAYVVRHVMTYAMPSFLDAISEGVPEVVVLEMLGLMTRLLLPAGTTLGWPGEPVTRWYLLCYGAVTSTSLQQLAAVPDVVVAPQQAAPQTASTTEAHAVVRLATTTTSSSSQDLEAGPSAACCQPYGQASTVPAAAGPEEVAGTSGMPAAAAATSTHSPFSKFNAFIHNRGSPRTQAAAPVLPPLAARARQAFGYPGVVGITLAAPSLLPCGTWLDPALPRSSSSSSSSSSLAGGEGNKCAAAPSADQAMHTMLLRTSQFSQVMAFDLGRTLDLCAVCPQLRVALQKLYLNSNQLGDLNVA